MKASVFDQRHSPTLSVQKGYTAWAATYDAQIRVCSRIRQKTSLWKMKPSI